MLVLLVSKMEYRYRMELLNTGEHSVPGPCPKGFMDTVHTDFLPVRLIALVQLSCIAVGQAFQQWFLSSGFTSAMTIVISGEIMKVQFQLCESREGLKGNCLSLAATVALNAGHCWSL